jgi:hypothetical protein
MRKYTRKQKIATALGAGAIAVAGAGTAFAYWSTSGSGTGTATVTNGYASNVTITNGALAGALVPGGSTTLPVTVTNPNAGAAKVGAVSGSVSGIVGSPANCSASDFTIDPTSVVGLVQPGALNAVTVSATIHFADDTANSQDGCKGASLSITWSSP